MDCTRIHVAPRLAQLLAVRVPWEDYQYFRYKSISLRFTLNSTPWFCGLLAVTYVPGSVVSNHMESKHALMQLPTHFIDASLNSVTEYEIMWPHAFNKRDAVDVADGALYIYPVTQLFNSTEPATTPNLKLVIEAHFNDPMLDFQTENGVSIQNLPDSTFALMATSFWGTAQVLTPQTEAQNKSKEGTLTGVAKATKNVAAVLKHIPIVGGFAAGAEIIASAAETVFSWFGLSKPPFEGMPSVVIPMNSFGDNYFEGIQVAHSLSRNPYCLVASDPALVCEEDDPLDLYSLARRESYLTTFNWSAGDVTGTVLHSFPVTPIQQIGTPNSAVGFTTHLGYVASMFRLWSGSITYRLKIAATPFFTGRIVVMYTPSSGVAYSANFRREEYTIKGTTDIEFTVPWTQSRPYKTIGVCSANANSYSSNNGYITICVSSPLVTTSAGSIPTVPVLLSSKGGPDLRFANFQLRQTTSPILYVDPAMNRFISRATAPHRELAQGNFGALDGTIQSGIVDEDNIVSLRQIAKAFVPYATLTAGQNKVCHFNDTTMLGYLTRKFKYYRGSIALRAIISGLDASDIVSLSRGVGMPESYISGNVNSMMNVILPFLNPYGFYESGGLYALTNFSETIYFNEVTTTGATCRLAAALQDDFVVGIVLPSPLMTWPV